MRKFGVFILIVVLLGALMFLMNPDEENFSSYLIKYSSGIFSKYTSGSPGNIEGMTDRPSPVESDYSNAEFTRQDYYIYSIYEITSPPSLEGCLYIGVMRVFIKIG